MIKALLRKELAQIKDMYLTNKRKGRKAGKGLFVFLIIMYFVIMLSLGALCAGLAHGMVTEGYGEVYYTIIGAMGFLVGIIGSVFTTAEMLFKAKDNEVLMAMPIPSSKIILVRMIGVYIMGFIYELLVMLPGVIIYWCFAGITVLNFLFGIIGVILIGFLITVFSCFFGWIIAIVTAKLKNKNILTVFISVIFIGLFVYLRFKANDFFSMLITNAERVGETVDGWAYPIVAAGYGMTGDILGMLLFLGATGVLFAITYYLISRSFYRIVNIKPTESKATFRQGQIKTASAGKALLRKELKRFTSSPNYMLNCGLGVLFLVAGIVMSLIEAEQVRFITEQLGNTMFGGARLAYVAGAFAVCLIAGFTNIAAPSISLEGPYIWVLQSMPVDPAQVLMAKFGMAVLIPAIPAALCALVIEIVLGSGILMIILSVVCAVLYVALCALLGLRLDLANPFLNWTNEAQPVKQSRAVLFSMLIGILAPLVPIAIYVVLAIVVAPEVYLIIWIVIMAVFIFLLIRWLRGRGAKQFALLGQ